MVEIKYMVHENDWSNVIDTIDRIKEWSQFTYKELEEDGIKFILFQFAENDIETAFYVGTFMGHTENNLINKQ